jgi:hypothetical protein
MYPQLWMSNRIFRAAKRPCPWFTADAPIHIVYVVLRMRAAIDLRWVMATRSLWCPTRGLGTETMK